MEDSLIHNFSLQVTKILRTCLVGQLRMQTERYKNPFSRQIVEICVMCDMIMATFKYYSQASRYYRISPQLIECIFLSHYHLSMPNSYYNDLMYFSLSFYRDTNENRFILFQEKILLRFIVCTYEKIPLYENVRTTSFCCFAFAYKE